MTDTPMSHKDDTTAPNVSPVRHKVTPMKVVPSECSPLYGRLPMAADTPATALDVDRLALTLDAPGVFEDPLDDALGLARDWVPAIEREAVAAWLASPEAVEELARAITKAWNAPRDPIWTGAVGVTDHDFAAAILAALRDQRGTS